MEFYTIRSYRFKGIPAVPGTMNFGPQTSEKDSFAIMDKALELGINFFDTANVYGWKTGEGVTEQIVGRWFGPGWRAAREGCHRYQSLWEIWAIGPTAKTFSGAHPSKQSKVRSSVYRPTTLTCIKAPRGPTNSLGGDLAGHGSARPTGQSDLRRLVELRRLAYRPGERSCPKPVISWGWFPSKACTTWTPA